jgi:hypothetical protein
MRRAVVTGVVLAVMLAFPVPRPAGKAEEREGRAAPRDRDVVSALMHQKLKHAQKVLEGLAVNDFDLIATHAQELVLLSKKAEWMVLKTPKYELRSNEFRRTAEDLIQNAKQKNLDAATLAYMDMTMSCVRCHKYVRQVRQARLDDDDSAVPVRTVRRLASPAD